MGFLHLPWLQAVQAEKQYVAAKKRRLVKLLRRSANVVFNSFYQFHLVLPYLNVPHYNKKRVRHRPDTFQIIGTGNGRN
jgi:hypothetical protein